MATIEDVATSGFTVVESAATTADHQTPVYYVTALGVSLYVAGDDQALIDELAASGPPPPPEPPDDPIVDQTPS